MFTKESAAATPPPVQKHVSACRPGIDPIDKSGAEIKRLIRQFYKTQGADLNTREIVDRAGGADERMGALRTKLKRAGRYLNVDPDEMSDDEIAGLHRSLVELLAPDAAVIDPVRESAREPRNMFDRSATPLDLKRAADLNFRKALTASRTAPKTWARPQR